MEEYEPKFKVESPDLIDKYRCIVSNSEKDINLLINKAEKMKLIVKRLDKKKNNPPAPGENGTWIEITSKDKKEFTFTKLLELFSNKEKQS